MLKTIIVYTILCCAASLLFAWAITLGWSVIKGDAFINHLLLFKVAFLINALFFLVFGIKFMR